MIVDIQHVSEQELTADYLVVGAGAVGLTLAIRLAESGARVALMEAGGEVVTEASQSLIEAARSVGSRMHVGLRLSRFRLLGGTTNFWGGQLVPFWDHLFAPRPWLRNDTAWPIKRADLDPYYCDAFARLGMARVVADDAELGARLGGDLPELPDDLLYFYTRWVPQPNLAIHFRPMLQESPNLTCYLNVQASAMEMDGDRVAAVHAVDAGGASRVFRARRVVFANGTVEIARLLKAPLAGGGAAPWHANRWLGRGFMDHLNVVAGRIRVLDRRRFSDAFETAVIDRIKYQPKIRLTADAQRDLGLVDICAQLVFNSSHADHFNNAKIFVRSFLRGDIRKSPRDYARSIYGLIRFGLPMAARYFRSNRVRFLADGGIDLWLSSEQVMVPESELRLLAETDRLGLSKVELDWRVDGRELETMRHFTWRLKEALGGSGIADIEVDPRLAAGDPAFLDQAEDTAHQMGMARMAHTAEGGVVDSDLKVFGSSNLYVAGAAVYPSAGFPNPTFTAIALGLRLADHLEKAA